MTTPHVSGLQYVQHPDGSVTLEGHSDVKLVTIQEQGAVKGRNWQSELNLPQFFEEWEVIARPRGMSHRHVRFVLMDEAPTRLPGNPRLQPQQITLPQTCPLELGHSSFVVGVVYAFVLGFDELRTQISSLLDFEVPADLEGDYIIGQAQLFDSDLAEKVWQGFQHEIFTHTCPVIHFAEPDLTGTGQLIEVSLTPGDYPGCEHARVLKMWE